MDVKSVIKKYGETVYTVAEKMGVSQPNVSQIINGNPTVKKLEDLARALGCSPAEFFSDWAQGGASAADELPFDNNDEKQEKKNDEQQPDLTADIAFICPHCHEAIKLGFIK